MDGVKVFNVHGSAMTQAGTPDLICCVHGRFLGLELKVGRNQPSPIQLVRLREYEAAGGFCGVAWSVEDVDQILLDLEAQARTDARLYPHLTESLD